MISFGRATLVVLLVITATVAFASGRVSPGTADAEIMQADVVLLLAYVLLALIFSFVCSVAEAVLLSVTPSYIAGLRDTRPKTAGLLKRLKLDDIDRSLAAILTLNTIAHTVGAIGAGAQATVVFGSTWFGLFSAIMTLLILFLSEIVPKTLGAVYWRSLAALTARFVRLLIVTLYPAIWVSERLTRLVARGKKVHVFSRDEFVAMAGIGASTGEIKEGESRIIRNLFRLDSLTARDDMTPRTVIVALRQNLTVAEALDTVAESPFSRLPVYRNNPDNITGFVLRSDLLLSQAKEQGAVILEQLKREISIIPNDMPLSDVLEFLLDHRQHIAVVAGEFGGTGGLVTLEDVVETLLGLEIVDEMDKVEDMRALARQQWAKRARALGLDPVATDRGPAA
jgi:CBS domain containing-hemolysin-like protein